MVHITAELTVSRKVNIRLYGQIVMFYDQKSLWKRQEAPSDFGFVENTARVPTPSTVIPGQPVFGLRRFML